MLAMSAVATDEYQYTNNNAYVNETSACYPWCNGDFQLGLTLNGATTVTGSLQQGAVNVKVGSPVGVIWFQGQPNATVYVELVQHMEFIGQFAAQNVTDSDVDPEGFAIATAAVAKVPIIKSSGMSRGKSGWNLFTDALGQLSAAIIPQVVPLAEKALLTLLL